MWRCYRLRWKVKIKTNNTASLSISDHPAHRQHTDHCYYGSVGKSILRMVMSFKSFWDTEHPVCFCGMIFSSSEICMPSPQDYRTTFLKTVQTLRKNVLQFSVWPKQVTDCIFLTSFPGKAVICILVQCKTSVAFPFHLYSSLFWEKETQVLGCMIVIKKNHFATENIQLHQFFRF